MKRIPAIKAAMTPFPHSIDRSAPLSAARAMMAEHGVRHLPVSDGQSVVGVVAERDLTLAATASRGDDAEAELTVADLPIGEPYTVELGTALDAVLDDMATRRIGAAIVLKAGKLVGIFTATDACEQFARLLRRDAVGDDEVA